MTLNGSFRETPFADLVQFYDVSKQTAVVKVRDGEDEPTRGLFLFSGGDLVGAAFDGAEGRDAVRAALRLRNGVFTAEPGEWPVDPVQREPLRAVLMEEVVKLDDEDRAGGPPPRPPKSGQWSARTVALLVLPIAVVAAAAWWFSGRAPRDAAPVAPAASVAAAAVAAPVRGVLDDGIVLGMVSSFTGSNKERGRAMRLGWDMAITEANAAGGVHGRKLRLVSQDDGYDPSRTMAGMKNVVEDQGAFAIVGNVGTSTAAVSIPYAAEKNAVFFGALSGGDLLRKNPPDRHVFNFRASLAREGEAAVRYLVEIRRIAPKRIAVIAQDDEFGASGRRGAVKQLASYDLSPDDVLQLTYPRNTADVRDAVARLQARARDFDAVVMVATYKPAATFVRKSKDAGLNLFYTAVSADSNGLAEELLDSGAQYTSNVLITQVVPVPSSHASTLIRYREALEKYAPGEKPGSTSLEAWIGAQIFLEGLRRAGRDLDTARLIAALESIQAWDIGIGGTIDFGPTDHQGCDVVWGWALQPDGTYRQVELE